MSPEGNNVVTGAGDETLRFWNIFPSKPHTITKKPSKKNDDFFDFKLALR